MTWLLETFLSNLNHFRPGLLKRPGMDPLEQVKTHDFEQVFTYFRWPGSKVRSYRCNTCGYFLQFSLERMSSTSKATISYIKTCNEHKMDEAIG